MKEKYYTINTDLKKKLLKKYINNQSGYKNWSITGNFLKILAVVLFIAMIYIFIIPELNTEDLLNGIILGLVSGSLFFCISFVIGHVIKLSGDNKYGGSYIVEDREFLIISEERVKAGYHEKNSELPDSWGVYEISKENMNAVIYDSENHIIIFIGEGKLTLYDDMQRKIINEKRSQRKFYENSPYEIMLAFDEEEEIVKLLKSMAKNARDK